jgi:predicted SAM-dependent methyltransferase
MSDITGHGLKPVLRRAIRRASSWPVVGRFARIGVAIIRGPQLLDARAQLAQAHAQLSERQAQLLADNERFTAFFHHEFPKILESLSEINHRQSRVAAEQETLAQSIPVALRAIRRDLHHLGNELGQRIASTAQQASDLSNAAGYLFGRVEFVRRELLYELRYGASVQRGAGEMLEASTEILAPEKLKDAREKGPRLNLGCGHVPLDGYLNIDRRALPGVDLVAEIDNLPFEDGEVAEIHSAHVLEHFPQEQLRRSLLPYWHRLLRTGGTLRAVVPDAEAMIDHYARGEYPYQSLREVTFGGQDYEGDFHFNMFTPESLTELLEASGFKDVRIVESGRRNGECYECEIVATKPRDSA